MLEREALAIWLELSTEQQASYNAAKAKIMKAMASVQFVSLDDYRAQKLTPNKVLSVFLHELRQMLKQAMREASEGTRKQLLLHQFVSGLPVNISRQLRATVALNNLDVVVKRAKLLMIIEEPQRTAAVQSNEIQDLKEANFTPYRTGCSIVVQACKRTSSCHMLQMSATWPSSEKLPINKKVLLVWTSWPCPTTMSIRKRSRGASEGAEAPQDQLEPLNVTSVIVAAVCPSAATIWGKICDNKVEIMLENKVEIMLDSGSSISLIQQKV